MIFHRNIKVCFTSWHRRVCICSFFIQSAPKDSIGKIYVGLAVILLSISQRCIKIIGFRGPLHHGFIFYLLFKKKLYDSFLWFGFNFLKAVEPLREDNLLLTVKSPGGNGSHLINPEKMKGCESTFKSPSVFAVFLYFYIWLRIIFYS